WQARATDTRAVFRVVLGSDGSRAAIKAANYAAQLLRHVPDVSVSVVYVRPARGSGLGPAAAVAPVRNPIAEELDQAEQGLLQRSRAPFERAGIPTVSRVDQGPPGVRLCQLAAEHGADLLVVGSRGHTELKALIMGSIS